MTWIEDEISYIWKSLEQSQYKAVWSYVQPYLRINDKDRQFSESYSNGTIKSLINSLRHVGSVAEWINAAFLRQSWSHDLGSSVRRIFEREGRHKLSTKNCAKASKSSCYYKHRQNFWWGRAKPKITCNNVIRNFWKTNFLWDKDIIKRKPRSHGLVYQSYKVKVSKFGDVFSNLV